MFVLYSYCGVAVVIVWRSASCAFGVELSNMLPRLVLFVPLIWNEVFLAALLELLLSNEFFDGLLEPCKVGLVWRSKSMQL